MSAALISAVVYGDNGDEFPVTVNSRIVLRWEKVHPGRSFDDIQGAMSGTYELVHLAAKKAGKIPEDMSLTDFCDGYDIDVQKDDEAADPTQPAA